MKLYEKLLKITFFKAKDTKWIICVAAFVIAMVSMLLTSANSIKLSYLQAVNQMPQYDFVLENLNSEQKQKYENKDFWGESIEDITCSTNVFELDIPDSTFYFSVTGLTGNFEEVYSVDLQEGRCPENDNEIVVDSKFIENSNDKYKIGDELVLSIFSMEETQYRNVSYEIVGIFGAKASSGSEVYAFCTLEGAQRALKKGNMDTSYRVMITAAGKNQEMLEKALSYIEAKDREQIGIRFNETRLEMNGEEETDGGGAVKVFQVLGILIGVVSGALLFNMLQVASGNKIQQIGLFE